MKLTTARKPRRHEPPAGVVSLGELDREARDHLESYQAYSRDARHDLTYIFEVLPHRGAFLALRRIIRRAQRAQAEQQ